MPESRRPQPPETAAPHELPPVGCRDAFLAFDKDRSGTIDVWELRQVLEAMGQKPTEEELFQMISEVDARPPRAPLATARLRRASDAAPVPV